MAAAEESEVESHLEQCEQCAQLLESLDPDKGSFIQTLKRLNPSSSRFDTIFDTTRTVIDNPARMLFGLQANPLRERTERWRLVRKLATGGIGEIWIATDLLFNREVAVKRLRKETAMLASVQRRFIYEAKITAQMCHPGTVHILDLVEDGPRSFYVMSLVKGQTLWRRIMNFHQASRANESLWYTDLVEMLRIWTMVTNTIAFAHANGVLHRDLKSDNIIVGDYGQVTVIDWGLAKAIAEPETESETDTNHSQIDANAYLESTFALDARRGTVYGARLGTPAFMAPEQARGDITAIDERTDIYALSAMLYEILTGRTPYDGEGPEEMMRAVQFDALVPPKSLVPEIPEQLDEICRKGLAKESDERFQTAGELAIAVESWMSQEAMRRQSDKARQQLFEMSDDLMLIFDQELRITWANEAWQRLLGWDPEKMVGERPEKWTRDDRCDDGTRDIDFLKQLSQGETVTGIRRKSLTTDGNEHWFSWTATPVTDEGISVAIGRDIDDLVKKSQELDDMLEVAPEAIVVVNPDRSIHRINSQVSEMFGYERDELIGLPIETLIPKRFHVVFDRFFKRYIRKPDAKPFLKRSGLQGRHKDGSLFKLGIRFSPVCIDGGFRIVSSIRRKTNRQESRLPDVP